MEWITMIMLFLLPSICFGYSTNSGNRNEGTSYTFSCNSGYFIDVTSASYYRCSSSSVNVLSTLQSQLDGHNSKTLTISDSLFGATSSSCTAYLYATWQCGRNGGWSAWGSWSECAVSCGGGVSVSRTRLCDNPSFEIPGTYCIGDSTETQYCNTQACESNENASSTTKGSDPASSATNSSTPSTVLLVVSVTVIVIGFVAFGIGLFLYRKARLIGRVNNHSSIPKESNSNPTRNEQYE